MAAPSLPACTSAFLGDKLVLRRADRAGCNTVSTPTARPLLVEAAKHPNKKCTAHHNKTRPKKHRPSDIKKGAKDYGPWPEPPPVWGLDLEGSPAAPPAASSV
eukprot:TRINITY_DN21767_c0_g1_i1.p1 TRINITY_DN21767_c0_g1~~TRINITY_DN21767_c0_g1_i1.p1  ORF type:complete len:118 (+),score=15.26 TRINITY_DN21767_c0_g1_i1:47-355(+)